jgi:hypothetical protein
LDKIIKAIQLFFAGKQKIKPHYIGAITDLSDVSNMALFFSVNSKSDFKDIRKLVVDIRNSGKHVQAYVYHPGYQNIDIVTDQSVLFFNLNDFTLFSKMKDRLDTNLHDTSFELLISFTPYPDPIALQIISEINADFKIGPSQPAQTPVYDLILKADIQNFNLKLYFQQITNYLGVLNIERIRADSE